MSQIQDRLEEIAKFAKSEQDVLALRGHLREILDSPSFSSSRRSGQFLQYVVEHALLQHNDALKERTIGVEVFHRAPDYDTGEDAIVRVTASDVRRRLAQHYGGVGRAASFRIGLPPGGYVPEIEYATDEVSPRLPAYPEIAAAPNPAPNGTTEHPAPASDMPRTSHATADPLIAPPLPTKKERISGVRLAMYGVVSAVTLLLFGLVVSGSRRLADAPVPEPWAKLFSGGQTVSVILADPDLNEIQLLTKQYLPLSDYANGRLGCETLTPELQRVCRETLRGDKVAEVDANAVVLIAQIAAQFRGHVEPHAARSLRLPDLQSDHNFVILGSKVADPWADLYRSRTDFYIDHDAAAGLQVVRNQHPRATELPTYTPTAGPYGTGDNYALISFVRNLGGDGYTLLLAGCTHEGMDAAMAALMNRTKFDQMAKACSISADKPFQMLLRLHMMAGSSLTAERVTCHQLD